MTLKFVKHSILIVGVLTTIPVVQSLLSPFGNFRTYFVPHTALIPGRIPKRSRPSIISTLQIFASDPKKNLNLEELQKVASDPTAFEAYVLQGRVEEKKKIEENQSQPKTNGTKGYVPIEQWDKERKRDDMTWEERVQFDGQKFGNRFNQNEILRHNLKTW